MVGVFDIVCITLYACSLALFARILLSWFPFNPDGVMATVTGFVYVVTDPVITPLRRRLPPLRLGKVELDMSAMIVLFAIMIMRRILGC